MPRAWKPTGKVAKLIEWLKAHPQETEITGTKAGEIMGIAQNNLYRALLVASKHDALFSRREGRTRFVSLTPYPAEPEPEPEPFNPCLWGDGDLVLRGVTLLEDGGVQIDAKDVPILKRLLNGTVVPG